MTPKSAKTAKSRTWGHELEVVGLGFRLKKETRQQLRRMVESKGSITGMRVEREPDNRFDPNAIMVFLPERAFHGAHIGYFHRETAELLAPKLDADALEVVSAKLTSVDGIDNKLATLVVRFRDKR